MSKQKAADPVFLEQQRKRLSAVRDQLKTTGSAGTALQRAPKAGEAKEMEDDAQDMAQSDVDGTIDAVEEERRRQNDVPVPMRRLLYLFGASEA